MALGRQTSSRNATATLAFHQARKDQQEREDGVLVDEVRVTVEVADNEKFCSRLRVKPADPVKPEIRLLGPERKSRTEAIRDGIEIGKAYAADGEKSVTKILEKLEPRRWTMTELANVDEKLLDKFTKTNESQPKEPVQKLIPPGEGWVRHEDDILVNPQSQIFFAQAGSRAGQYLKRVVGKWEKVAVPHVSQEFPVTVRPTSACVVRKGAKLDRAVLLPDVPKIARLALKFPLSFVDLPACAYSVFQGHRSSEASQWCAENFHKKLLPILAEKIHTYEKSELQAVLRKTLEALDAELLKSTFAFSGCSALIALVLGDRLVVAGVGHVRAVILPESGPVRPLLECTGAPSSELARVRGAGARVQDGLITRNTEGLEDAGRVLAARNSFEVLQIEPGGPTDEKQVRTAYRKLALRVHPDKQNPGADVEELTAAFARLEKAKEDVEALLAAGTELCRELYHVLRCEVHTRTGAAVLLGVDDAACTDTTAVVEEAQKASKKIIKRLEPMRGLSADYQAAVDICEEAVETIRRPGTAEALPRQEALLREGLSTSRAMGARDMRRPWPVVLMEPETAALALPSGRCRLGLLCGSSAALSDERLRESSARLQRQPKATSLRWCLEAGPTASNSSAVCIGIGPKADPTEQPLAKRQRLAGPEGTVRGRHILIAYRMKQPDPLGRREGARSMQEAEEVALGALETLLRDAAAFPRLCRELSDCQSGSQPGVLTGDLGWLGRGQQDPAFEDVIFALKPNEFGDLVATSRGIHVIQRLA